MEDARKHFEAVIASIAKMYGIQALDLREDVKAVLSDRKVIRLSTTELTDSELKDFAHRMTIFQKEQENNPPEWRTELNLAKILFP